MNTRTKTALILLGLALLITSGGYYTYTHPAIGKYERAEMAKQGCTGIKDFVDIGFNAKKDGVKLETFNKNLKLTKHDSESYAPVGFIKNSKIAMAIGYNLDNPYSDSLELARNMTLAC